MMASPNTVFFDFENTSYKSELPSESVESSGNGGHRKPGQFEYSPILNATETSVYHTPSRTVNRNNEYSSARKKLFISSHSSRIHPRSESRSLTSSKYVPKSSRASRKTCTSIKPHAHINLYSFFFPFVTLLKKASESVFNVNRILEDLQRTRLNQRISACLLRLQQARIQSELAKTPTSKKKRSSTYSRLGNFGMTLFSPLEAVFDHDETSSSQMMHAPHSSEPTKKSLNSTLEQHQVDDDSKSTACSSLEEEEAGVSIFPEQNLEFCPHILSTDLMNEISTKGLPATCQSRTWKRIFSVARDGDSFCTFLRKVQEYKMTLIVIKTERNKILGGFADHTWEKQRNRNGRIFFGGGQTFLFSTKNCEGAQNYQNDENDETSELSPENFSSTHRNKTYGHEIVNVYKWTAANNYNQYISVEDKRIGMGGGGRSGSFGFCIQDDFSKASSGACATYGNPPLGSVAGDNSNPENFEIIEMDVYGFVHSWI